MLYVQFVELGNTEKRGPFEADDFVYATYKTANIQNFRDKFEIGVLATKQPTKSSPLPPIVKGSPHEVPFDASFPVVSFPALEFKLQASVFRS